MNLAGEMLRGNLVQNIANVLVFSLFSAATIVMCVWAVLEWRRHRPALSVFFIGSIFSAWGDAGFRLMAGLHTPPETSHPVLYEGFGIQVGIWMLPLFPVYVAGIGYLTYLALERRWSPRRFWAIIAASICADAAAEWLAINVGQMYVYRGPQPLQVLGLPLVSPFALVAAPALTGALVFFMDRHLNGVRKLLLIPLAGAAAPGMTTVVAWPMILARHSSLNPTVVSLFGLATIAYILIVFHVLTTFLRQAPSRHPAEPTAPQAGARPTATVRRADR